jgi:predicted MFS family arabinose efflux permease
MGTSLGIGSAVGSSLTGRVLDVAGPAGGFQATMVFSALAALIALASFRALRRSVPD